MKLVDLGTAILLVFALCLVVLSNQTEDASFTRILLTAEGESMPSGEPSICKVSWVLGRLREEITKVAADLGLQGAAKLAQTKTADYGDQHEQSNHALD